MDGTLLIIVGAASAAAILCVWIFVSIPAWIAGRDHPNLLEIRILACLGLVLGITLGLSFGITWLVALIWAFIKPSKDSPYMTLRYGDRHELTEEDALVYAKLRELRKEIATSEGISLYFVFNNKELLEMVRKKARTKQDLEGIVGVGSPRVEKYGERFLEFMAKEQGTEKKGEPSV